MARFIILPAAYLSPYDVQAETIDVEDSSDKVVTLSDKQGEVVAVISLENVAAVYRERE